MFRRTILRVVLRATPAPLKGVSGRPMRALAVSGDSVKPAPRDHWTDTGMAQMRAAPSATVPTVNIFMTFLPFQSPVPADQSRQDNKVSAFAVLQSLNRRRRTPGHLRRLTMPSPVRLWRNRGYGS